jgi:plastocyanin
MLNNRRDVLRTGGLLLAGLAAPAVAPTMAHEFDFRVDIDLRSDVGGARVWFDPIGVLVQPGAAIRWTTRQNVHTATAYHPDNDNHSLRIPKGATPWDSGYLVNSGDAFETVLTVPGVYDYYCEPHEFGGMVGRIIVADATGPGARPFDYFKSLDPAPGWVDVPDMAQNTFSSIKAIMENEVVRL